MTTTHSPLSAESIVSLHDQAVAMPVILSGVIDAKIAELKAIQADLVARQGIVDTVEQAQAVLDKANADATAILTAAQVTADKNTTDAAQKLAAAESLLDQALKREEETSSMQSTIRAQRAQLDADIVARNAAVDALQAQSEKRLADVEMREKSLALGMQRLKDDRAAFNAKLDALKT